jgi:hypothetical protein
VAPRISTNWRSPFRISSNSKPSGNTTSSTTAGVRSYRSADSRKTAQTIRYDCGVESKPVVARAIPRQLAHTACANLCKKVVAGVRCSSPLRNTRPQNTHQFACAQQIRVQSVAGRGVENFDQLVFPLPLSSNSKPSSVYFRSVCLTGKLTSGSRLGSSDGTSVIATTSLCEP